MLVLVFFFNNVLSCTSGLDILCTSLLQRRRCVVSVRRREALYNERNSRLLLRHVVARCVCVCVAVGLTEYILLLLLLLIPAISHLNAIITRYTLYSTIIQLKCNYKTMTLLSCAAVDVLFFVPFCCCR